MALGNTSVSLDTLLKELYSEDRVTNTMFTKNKLWAMVQKKEDVVGREFVLPLTVGGTQARSAGYPTVVAAEALTSEQVVNFKVPLNENFAAATVSSRIIAESSSSKGAFLSAVKLISDNSLITFGNDIAASMYRSSDGNRGQVGSIVTPSGGVANSRILFKVPKDALLWEIGMQFDAWTATTGGSQRAEALGHPAYIKAVDYVAGSIDIGTLPNSGATSLDVTTVLTSIQAGDYLFPAGDRGLKMNGFQDWIPYGGPSVSDSFNGVNRSANPVRLAGLWKDGRSGTSLASLLEDAISDVGEVGGELSHFFMNYKQYALLAKELGSKVQLANVEVDGKFGFEGIQIVGATGPVVCLPDRTCPSDTICGMNIDTWKLMSIGKACRIWDMDGKVWLRTPSDSGMEIRFYSLCNMICTDPRQNINIKVTP